MHNHLNNNFSTNYAINHINLPARKQLIKILLIINVRVNQVDSVHFSSTCKIVVQSDMDREFTPSSSAKWVRDALRSGREMTVYLPTSLDPSSVNAKMSFDKVANCLLITCLALANGMPQDGVTPTAESPGSVSRKIFASF